MTVFFDIDDTLYDRGLPFIAATQEFFRGAVSAPREAYRLCTKRGNEVFLPSQRGEISMEKMYIYRWKKGFMDAGIAISDAEALSFQSLYREKQNCITLSAVPEETLRYCAEKADGIGIITNGPSEKQWNKIARLGIERFVKREMIIISGDIGIDKPDSAIFRLAEERSGARAENLLYVGDSLKNDIYPAAFCGWRTLWVNCDGAEIPADLPEGTPVCSPETLAEAVKSLI